MPDLSDRLLAAQYLEKQGHYYSMLLLDHGVPVAGHSFVVHQRDLVAHVTYRQQEYDWYGVSTRLLDLAFHWAAEAGFEKLDLGGGYDYKARWAPQDGERTEFNVYPTVLYRARQFDELLRNLRAAVAGG